MSRHEPKQVLSIHSSADCDLCDEYGWVIGAEEKTGWAHRCRHDPEQLLTPKPADVHQAARLLREGRAREEAHPQQYRRASDGADPTPPRRIR
jgi:hypothetical protein